MEQKGGAIKKYRNLGGGGSEFFFIFWGGHKKVLKNGGAIKIIPTWGGVTKNFQIKGGGATKNCQTLARTRFFVSHAKFNNCKNVVKNWVFRHYLEI